MGIKEFTQEVRGVSEIQRELAKVNADSKRNYILSVLGLIVAIIALIRTW